MLVHTFLSYCTEQGEKIDIIPAALRALQKCCLLQNQPTKGKKKIFSVRNWRVQVIQ